MKSSLLPLLICISSSLFAQGPIYDQPVKLSYCKVSVQADVFVAKTTVELHFYNDQNREVEGLRDIRLHAGQIITGFELELNGKFREGSIEERGKANNAYRSIVGKRIDPAIISMLDNERYRLNIYPIPAKGTRKVKLIIEQLMEPDSNGMQYTLPTQFLDRETAMQVDVCVSKWLKAPWTNAGLIEKSHFAETKGLQLLNWQSNQVVPGLPISVTVPLEPGTSLCCTGKQKGEFALAYLPAKIQPAAFKPKSISVFWDVSSSAAVNRDIDKELDFLESYILQKKITIVECIFFNQKIKEMVQFNPGKDQFSTLRHFIKSYAYVGATSMCALNFSKLTTDVVLLFSDGIQTLDQLMPVKGNAPVFSVVSSEQYNKTGLMRVLANSGGKIINLFKADVTSALQDADALNEYVISANRPDQYIQITSGLPQQFNSMPVVVTGNAYRPDSVYVSIGNRQQRLNMLSLYVNPADICDSNLLPAMRRIQEALELKKNGSHYENLLFGLNEKIVTVATSYLVLERREDYIRYQIAPPFDLVETCAAEGYVYDSRILRESIQKKYAATQQWPLLNKYNQRLNWWGKSQLKNETPTDLLVSAHSNQNLSFTNNSLSGESPGLVNTSRELNSVVVTGISTSRSKQSLGYATSLVQQKSITQLAPSSIGDVLVGRVSGLQVELSAGGVFRETRINLRGVRSLNGNNQPLWILDGMPIQADQLQTINPNSISHIEVLKSAAAAAIYGSQGANGVVIIKTKRIRNFNYPIWKSYDLAAMDDVDYLLQMNEVNPESRWSTYKDLCGKYRKQAGFYYDMADYFFKNGDSAHAKEIFYEAAEAFGGAIPGTRALAYLLESWKQFDEAILLYQGLLQIHPTDWYTKRDLALAYFQTGAFQKAADVYQEIILQESDMATDESVKLLALNEWNAIAALHPEVIRNTKLHQGLINPLPVDLYITASSNYGYTNFQIEEPTGEICSPRLPKSKNAGYFETIFGEDYYNADHGSYSVKHATDGIYKVNSECHNWGYSNQRIPKIVRVIYFRKFQSKEQQLQIENFVVDNQYGIVTLKSISWK